MKDTAYYALLILNSFYNSRGILKVLLLGNLRLFLFIAYYMPSMLSALATGEKANSCTTEHYYYEIGFSLWIHLKNLFLLDFTIPYN